ncbi:hypothetical protein RCG19_19775 [Neobacillus sp. OS1-2]|uniref:MotE family protein n=1 Tax=Neobacillus sp. OS1-2 TaxID=3070680 RepID=UPI0027E11B8E|nr:hypothetical protein [Neobacillus sp. OS1-2]WML39394.1 hypothetical protein RCG19_19775 [Neobacillus sp. OS1-2]
MEEKQQGKLKSLLYFGLIPLLFLAIFGLFIFNWLGFPVWKSIQEWGNNTPVISMMMPDPDPSPQDDAKKTSPSDDYKAKYLDSNQKVKEEAKKIASLEKQIKSNQEEFDQLKKSNIDLQNQLDQKAAQKNKDQLKQVAAIYENMAPSKAAKMFEVMSLEDAAITMSSLGQEQQSNILGSMKDAKKAAQITMLLKEIGTINDTDPAILKDELQKIVQNDVDPAGSLVETIAGMPAAQSASLIQSMMETNAQVAMNVLKQMSTTNRSQILTEIAKKDAKIAAQITVNLEK